MLPSMAGRMHRALSWARQRIDRLTDVPRTQYPDAATYWRARAMLAFCLMEMLLGLCVFGAQPAFSSEYRVRLLQIAPVVLGALLGSYWLIRRTRGGLTIAGWVLIPALTATTVLWCVSGYGIFDTAIFGFFWFQGLAALLLGSVGVVFATVCGTLALGVLTYLSRSGWQGWLVSTPIWMPRGAVESFGLSGTVALLASGFVVGLLEYTRRRLVTTTEEDVRRIESARQEAAVLAETNRLRSAFLGNISHEFRTPITLSLGAIESVLLQELSPAGREQLEVARRQNRRLLKLVATLLDFARVEDGRLGAHFSPIDLSGLTADLASEFRAAMEAAGLRFSIDCPPLPALVYVDSDLWEKVVMNLLSNALKFTLQGEVRLSLRCERDHVELEVRDTGCGISAEELPRIFERFYSTPARGARSEEGTGIGLALVQELVRVHGGTMRVASHRDRGSAFTVSLPLGCAHLSPSSLREHRQAAHGAGASLYVEEAFGWLPPSSVNEQLDGPAQDSPGRLRLLLIDDNRDMRAYLHRLLAGQYEVRSAASGEEALQMMEEALPDLILSDVMMPGMGGLELVRRLRVAESTRALPIVVLSARADEASALAALAAGADDYLIKPFSARELLARLQARCRRA